MNVGRTAISFVNCSVKVSKKRELIGRSQGGFWDLLSTWISHTPITAEDKWILDSVNLTVRQGQMTALVGPSAAGKSTLFKLAMGSCSLQHDRGHIWVSVPFAKKAALAAVPNSAVESIDGGDRVDVLALSPTARRGLLGNVIAAVPQLQPNPLDPLRSPLNMLADAVGAHCQQVSRDEAMERANESLAWVGLPTERRDAPSSQLSGGQSQRVLVALARVNRPTTYLFDEPTSALDPRAKCELLDLMDSLTDSGAAVVLVTHDLASARRADDVVILDRGRVIEQGPADDVLSHPLHRLTKQFIAAEMFPFPDV